MTCPKCHHRSSRAVDTRLVKGGSVRWRRRECQECAYRWTTYEIAEVDWREAREMARVALKVAEDGQVLARMLETISGPVPRGRPRVTS